MAEEKKPDDFIINPMLAIHSEIDDLVIDVGELKKVSDKHTELLSAILDRESKLLKELEDIRDQGGKLSVSGIAQNNRFSIIDTNVDPGHKVKSAVVVNNGPNTLFVGEDAAYSPEVDADIIDIVSDQTRFIQVLVGESERFAYNVRSIKSIHILSDPNVVGSSNFRVRMAW